MRSVNDSWECSQFHSRMTSDYTSDHLQFQFFCVGGDTPHPPSSSIRGAFASVGHVYLFKYEYKLTQSAYATEFRKRNYSWLYDYPLANHIASYETLTNREVSQFRVFSLLSEIPGKTFKTGSITFQTMYPAKGKVSCRVAL